MTPVLLTNEQAQLFILFSKHYNTFAFMLEAGVFDTKRGNVTLNFDKDGRLLSIDRHIFTYAKQGQVDNFIVPGI